MNYQASSFKLHFSSIPRRGGEFFPFDQKLMPNLIGNVEQSKLTLLIPFTVIRGEGRDNKKSWKLNKTKSMTNDCFPSEILFVFLAARTPRTLLWQEREEEPSINYFERMRTFSQNSYQKRWFFRIISELLLLLCKVFEWGTIFLLLDHVGLNLMGVTLDVHDVFLLRSFTTQSWANNINASNYSKPSGHVGVNICFNFEPWNVWIITNSSNSEILSSLKLIILKMLNQSKIKIRFHDSWSSHVASVTPRSVEKNLMQILKLSNSDDGRESMNV